jgi:hypothetical protein
MNNPLLAAFEAQLSMDVTEATSVMFGNLEATAPQLGRALQTWFQKRVPGAQGASYFVHPDAYPVVSFPQLYARSVKAELEPVAHRTTLHSTVAACVWIRLVDDVMDESEREARALLPALATLQEEIFGPYRAAFAQCPDAVHRLTQVWGMAGEHTHADFMLDRVDEAAFLNVVRSKCSAARMPIVAAATWLGDPSRIAVWSRFIDAYSAWHQMLNDTFDWASDLEHRVPTYFLTQAEGCVGSDRVAITGWVIDRGLRWASERIDAFWSEARAAAEVIDVPLLDAMLERRRVGSVAEMQRLIQAAGTFAALRGPLGAAG